MTCKEYQFFGLNWRDLWGREAKSYSALPLCVSFGSYSQNAMSQHKIVA